ncbi:hypothetical protein QE152_g39256 [Popillia japonica]|uniref:Uncharacterized protein n=1 Tax=Popillia japonica TaxID=7064 RepID=A0AAW1HUI7_POPJA
MESCNRLFNCKEVHNIHRHSQLKPSRHQVRELLTQFFNSRCFAGRYGRRLHTEDDTSDDVVGVRYV